MHFFSLKLNKSPGYDDISFYVIKNCFELLHNSYFLLLTYLLNRVSFLSTILNIKLLKKVSVLTCFPEILKQVMPKKPYKYLVKNNIF